MGLLHVRKDPCTRGCRCWMGLGGVFAALCSGGWFGWGEFVRILGVEELGVESRVSGVGIMLGGRVWGER